MEGNLPGGDAIWSRTYPRVQLWGANCYILKGSGGKCKNTETLG